MPIVGILEAERKTSKLNNKIIKKAFLRLYNIEVEKEAENIPEYLHRKCFLKIERAFKKVVTNLDSEIPKIAGFFLGKLIQVKNMSCPS